MVTLAATSPPANPPATPDAVRALLEAVTDPEIPVLTIGDLGILRDVQVDDAGGVTVVITPTYTGCPAMSAIDLAIRERLLAAGCETVRVKTVLSPAWTDRKSVV